MLAPKKIFNEKIAMETVTIFYQAVTPVVPGVTFMSKGQSEKEVFITVNAVNK